jgi:hypothetical protein
VICSLLDQQSVGQERFGQRRREDEGGLQLFTELASVTRAQWSRCLAGMRSLEHGEVEVKTSAEGDPCLERSTTLSLLRTARFQLVLSPARASTTELIHSALCAFCTASHLSPRASSRLSSTTHPSSRPSSTIMAEEGKLLAESLATVRTQLGQLKRCLVSL